MQWVKQEHENGCGFAALAMLVGKTYDELIAEFNGDAHSNGYRYNPAQCSPMYMDMDRYLAEHGFAVARIYEEVFPFCRNETREWPPHPFADLHLCNVTVNATSQRHHWVVMIRDGRVFDPLTDEPRRLADYHKINNVGAIVPINKEIE